MTKYDGNILNIIVKKCFTIQYFMFHGLYIYILGFNVSRETLSCTIKLDLFKKDRCFT